MTDELLATRVLTAGGRAVSARIRRVRLHIVQPDGAARVAELGLERIRVGARGAQVAIEDPALSRIHFEICADPHGFRLRDLGSTNGTFVDGVRTVDAYLRANATIVAGATELRFEPLATEADLPISPGERFGPVLGKCPAMRIMFSTLERIARSNTAILIEGESGTGKALVAHATHRASLRAQHPFVVFDCAGVASRYSQTELFARCLAEANGGTLFLDEVGDVPLDLQPALLRSLDDVAVDVRVIAATSRDLAREVNTGEFRDDLYHRLAGVRVVAPPLRERPGDLPLLVEAFLTSLYRGDKARADAAIASLPDGIWTRLAAWPWRGNVRELRTAVARAVTLAGDALPSDITPFGVADIKTPAVAETADRPFVDLRAEVVDRFEREYLRRVLAKCDGHVVAAATVAGIASPYFKRLMKKYGLG